MVAFGLTLQASWEGIAVTFQSSLLNGGPASMVYGAILGGTGSMAIALSMAEMASMYGDIPFAGIANLISCVKGPSC